MVIVQLQGGLGNQLFQYAAGRSLALRAQTQLKLDPGQLYCAYRLGIFGLPAAAAHKRDLPFEFRQPYRSRLGRKLLEQIPSRLLRHLSATPCVVREKAFTFDERVLQLSGDVYLIGFWQSPRYFESIMGVIRSDLSLSAAQAGVMADVATQVGQEGTVSVHVRRGDYVTHPLMSPCPAAYYRAAMELLARRTRLRRVYVFSDDIAWAQEHLTFSAPTTFVSPPDGGTDMGDFYLMSQCHHHVIANSTFSWWAAWLGWRPGGLVVSPGHWFNDASIDTRDLRPADWLVA